MKTKTKKDLHKIVDVLVKDYDNATSIDEKGKILNHVIKGVNAIKEIENQDVENLIKQKRFELDEEKIEIEKKRLTFDSDRMELDKSKLDFENDKFRSEEANENRKLELDNSKLEFEQKKLSVEQDTNKKERIFNVLVKGLEIGLPLIIYAGLSVLSLKAIYKDDVRVPSETWNFIKGVSKR